VKILLLVAHPVPDAFNHQLKETALATLAELGHQVEVADLYAEGFDPAQAGPARIEAERARLARADLLLCQFPIWWFRPPAMLLGWLEQVIPWPTQPWLAGKRVLLSATAGGSPDTYRAAGVSQEPTVLFRPILETCLGRSGCQPLPPFVAWGMLKAGEAERAAHREALAQHVRAWVRD
jgi:NAD(P)H dehydrogenase (quinone)